MNGDIHMKEQTKSKKDIVTMFIHLFQPDCYPSICSYLVQFFFPSNEQTGLKGSYPFPKKIFFSYLVSHVIYFPGLQLCYCSFSCHLNQLLVSNLLLLYLYLLLNFLFCLQHSIWCCYQDYPS